MPTRARRLFNAIEKGRLSTVVAMLDEDPSLVNVYGEHNARVRDKTPLMYALQCGARQTARELIKRGADVSARMAGGPRMPVIRLAVKFAGPREQDHRRMLGLVGELIDAGADPSEALYMACHQYNASRSAWGAEMIKLLLKRGADPNHPVGDTGNTIRELVALNAQRYKPEVLELLAQKAG